MARSVRAARIRATKRVAMRLGLLPTVAGATLALAQPAQAVPRQFFGVVSSGDTTNQDFNRMATGKVGSFRIGLFWPEIQQTKDAEYDWTKSDRIIGNLAARGIRTLPFLYGSPAWAAPHRKAPPLGTAAARAGWKSFLREAVNRYGHGGEYWTTKFLIQHPAKVAIPIVHWQVWNEQNSSTFFKPRPSPKKYAKLLKISAKAIRGADSRAKVMLGGMFGTPGRPRSIRAWRFLNKLYAIKRLKRKFDAVAAHPYSPRIRGVRYQVKKLRRSMRSHRDGATAMHVTEIGWGSGSGHPLTKGRKGQARMLKRSFRLLLRKRWSWKIRGIYWYKWRDRAVPGPCPWCPSTGLFDQTLTPKPAWRKYTSFTGGT